MEVCIEAFNGNEQVELLRAQSLKSDDILTKAHAVYYEGQRYTSGEVGILEMTVSLALLDLRYFLKR